MLRQDIRDLLDKHRKKTQQRRIAQERVEQLTVELRLIESQLQKAEKGRT